MQQQYMVALVAPDGHPEYGPVPIMADNVIHAAELAFTAHAFPVGIPETVVVVKLPGVPVGLTFHYGSINY